MLPLRARVDQGAMAMNGYLAFPKAPALLEPTIRLFLSYPVLSLGVLAEVQSVYSTAPADCCVCS